MAAVSMSSFPALRPPPPSSSLPTSSSSVRGAPLPLQRCYRALRRPHHHHGCRAMKDLLGDWGARDPFPEEVESRFGEKVLGCSNTEHKILIPNLAALSLSQLSCEPCPQSLPAVDAHKLMNKVVGWRLVEGKGPTKLQCLWKVRDYGCGVELICRIHKVAEAIEHYPNLHLEQSNQVRAELWTHSIGSLSMNDFILAAKIDEIKILDLIPRKRVWA